MHRLPRIYSSTQLAREPTHGSPAIQIRLVTYGASLKATVQSRSTLQTAWNRWGKSTSSGKLPRQVLIRKKYGLPSCTFSMADGTSILPHLMETTPTICRMSSKAKPKIHWDLTHFMDLWPPVRDKTEKVPTCGQSTSPCLSTIQTSMQSGRAGTQREPTSSISTLPP